VSSYARNSKLAAYQSVSVHGGVANADPHGLVLMLMDGAVERMNAARGCIERGDIVRKAKLLHSCISLIAELRGCLDMARGGAIAQNLSDLYDYMMRQLARANVDNNPCVYRRGAEPAGGDPQRLDRHRPRGAANDAGGAPERVE
jgi:flagellar protein FliS